MNRGAYHQSHLVHEQMMGGVNPSASSFWSLDNMRGATTTEAQQMITHSLLPSSSPISNTSSASSTSSSSSSVLSQFMQPSNLQLMANNWSDNSQELPESWSQLLLGGLVEEEGRYNFTPFPTKKMENWLGHQLLYPSPSARMFDIKQELSEKGCVYGQPSEEIQAPKSPWSQILSNSSPRSCVTTSFNSSMLDFSNNKAEARNPHLDNSSQECNSIPTGSPYKKARVQASSSTQPTFKVRKEKLGDRITALHQLVSPFGKTDTASVLLEAIGYIRFLQSQIEALSSPYLASGSGATSGNNLNMKQQQHHHQNPAAQGDRSCIFPEDPGQLVNDNCIKRRGATDHQQDGNADHEQKKDLRSRGLCLVPVSFTLHVGSENGADYWAPNFGGGFR